MSAISSQVVMMLRLGEGIKQSDYGKLTGFNFNMTKCSGNFFGSVRTLGTVHAVPKQKLIS